MNDSPLILVIEASPTQAARLEFQLAKKGYRSMAAAGAAQALETARAHRPDLVVVEIDLRDGDGFSLCRELAGAPEPAPVLFFSSQDDPGSVARGLACGAAGFVAKREGAERLLEGIGEILADRVPQTCASGLRVLVADDNKVNLMLAEWALTRAGHATTVVSCGEEAIAQAQDRSFDLILMDIQMPGVDGAQAAHSIRSGGGPSVNAPILALTGHTSEELGALGDGVFDGYIPKPFELAAFNRVAAAALAKRRP
jgi:CheY-like chemotaxis protein